MGYYKNNSKEILGIILSRGIRTAGFSNHLLEICHEKGWRMIGDIYTRFEELKKTKGVTKQDIREVRNWFIEKHIKLNENGLVM